MAASHGELMFSFLGKCQLLPKVVILFNILGTVQLPTSSLTACCLPSPCSGRFLSLCLFWDSLTVLLCSPGWPVTGALPASVSRWWVPHTTALSEMFVEVFILNCYSVLFSRQCIFLSVTYLKVSSLTVVFSFCVCACTCVRRREIDVDIGCLLYPVFWEQVSSELCTHWLVRWTDRRVPRICLSPTTFLLSVLELQTLQTTTATFDHVQPDMALYPLNHLPGSSFVRRTHVL